MSPEISSLEKVQIDSKETLRAELGILSPIEIPEITRAFEVTRRDLDVFKKSLENLPTKEQIAKLRLFIKDKTEALHETQDKTEALKQVIGAGGVAAVATNLQNELGKGMDDLKNAKGTDVFEKASTVWDRMGKMWDSLILSVASTSFGRMILDFFGIDIPESVMSKPGVTDAIKNPVDRLSDEKKKEIDEKLFKTVNTDLVKQYGLNPDEKLPDGTTKGEKLRMILKKRTESMHSIFIDANGVVNINAKNLSGVLWNGAGLVYDLVKEGVLDSSSMTFDFVTTAKGTVRYAVKSVSGMDISNGLTGEIALDKINDSLSSNEKMFLLAVFYRKGGFVTNVLGDLAYLMAQPMRLLNSFDNIGTFSTRIPGLTQKIEKMDQIIAVLSKIAPENAADIKALREMKSVAESTKKAIETAALYKANKIPYEEAKATLNKLQGTYKNMDWAKHMVMKTSGLDAWNKAYIKDLFIDRNEMYIETLVKSIDPKSKFGGVFEKIKSYFQFLEIPGEVNRTTMYFKNPKDFSEFMKEMGVLASQSPEFVRWLFSHLPVFIVGGMAIHEGMKPDGDVSRALLNFVPLVGPVIMLSEANIKVDFKNKTVDTEHLTEGIAGAALLGLDGYILTKLVLSKGGALGVTEFIMKPAIDITKATASLVRLSGTVWKVAIDGIRLGASYLSRFPGPAKVAAAVLAGISLLAITGEALASDSPEDIRKKLEKEKLIDADGKPNLLRLKEKFKTLSDGNKKQILDIVAMTELSAYGAVDIITGTEYKNGVYVIKTKKEHRAIIEKSLLSTTLYSEFELVDNIHIETA